MKDFLVLFPGKVSISRSFVLYHNKSFSVYVTATLKRFQYDIRLVTWLVFPILTNAFRTIAYLFVRFPAAEEHVYRKHVVFLIQNSPHYSFLIISFDLIQLILVAFHPELLYKGTAT